MIILYSVLMLGVLGIIFGIMLAFASKKFAVEVDPRMTEVREHLSGANCGACGYPGCDGYANAVVEGIAPVDACRPAGPDAAEAIGKIMGVSVGPSLPFLAYPICNGTIGNTREVYDYDGIQTCVAANLFAGGPKSCRFACLGYGDCVVACPFDALEVVNGQPVIDVDKCTGCGACQKVCPKQVIKVTPAKLPVLLTCRNTDMGKRVKDVCTRGCIACRKCSKACEQEAITFENNLPKIDYDKCIKCGKCADTCPTNCISKFEKFCIPQA